jgi:hypothetical protein
MYILTTHCVVQPAVGVIVPPAVPTLHDICSKLGDMSDPGFENLIKLIDLILNLVKFYEEACFIL